MIIFPILDFARMGFFILFDGLLSRFNYFYKPEAERAEQMK